MLIKEGTVDLEKDVDFLMKVKVVHKKMYNKSALDGKEEIADSEILANLSTKAMEG